MRWVFAALTVGFASCKQELAAPRGAPLVLELSGRELSLPDAGVFSLSSPAALTAFVASARGPNAVPPLLVARGRVNYGVLMQVTSILASAGVVHAQLQCSSRPPRTYRLVSTEDAVALVERPAQDPSLLALSYAPTGFLLANRFIPFSRGAHDFGELQARLTAAQAEGAKELLVAAHERTDITAAFCEMLSVVPNGYAEVSLSTF